MTDAHYTFVPLVRRGAPANIPAVTPSDVRMNRATFPVHLDVTGGPLSVDVSLYGPGDVTGIDDRQITRTDPEPNTTEFEPNYFPTVEFDRADFPWLFTPVGPSDTRLPPWLVLVVVRRDDATLSPGSTESLSVLEAPTGQLPELSESWAWAHAQVVSDSVPRNVAEHLRKDDEQVTSRLICPRRLDWETSYYACLVPAFDSGRRAGLGEAVPEGPLTPAWEPAPGSGTTRLPVYYHWEFKTGRAGDFEALVRRLSPVRLPANIGGRAVDATSLYNDLGLDVDADPPSGPATVRIEGALRAATSSEQPAPSGPFEQSLRDVLNAPAALEAAGDLLTDGAERTDAEREEAVRTNVNARMDLQSRFSDSLDAVVQSANTLSRRGNPIIVTPPLYGGFQADERLVPADDVRPLWLGQLNLDPRYRAVSNYGTRVIQRNQEELMAAAWEQVDQLEGVNDEFLRGQFARAVVTDLYERDLARLSSESLFVFTGPMHPRVRGPRSETVRTLVADSALPGATFSGEFRRFARPEGPIGRRVDADLSVTTIVETMNDPASVLTPSTERPEGTITLGDIDAALEDRGALMADLVLRAPVDERVTPIERPGVDGLPHRTFDMNLGRIGLHRNNPALGLLSQGGLFGGEGVPLPEELSGFGGRVTLPPPADINPAILDAINAPADRFLSTLRDRLEVISGEPLVPFETDQVGKVLLDRLDPSETLRDRLLDRLVLSEEWALDENRIERIIAAPTFPRPMYEPLKELSQELLLPGVEQVPADSVGLLKTNPEFIESFMAGLNHEMSRELLWREFPTDMRGTYFRHFWDTSGALDATRTEDIKPIHTWDDAGSLGEAGLVPEARTDDLVLLVRGELFRRYPRTIVYVVPAVPPEPDPETGESPLPDDPTGLDVLRYRRPSPDPTAEYPLFRGTLDPDMTFFGFNLDPEQARGTRFETREARDAARNSAPEDVSLGWYIVLQQESTKARFGLDAAEGKFGTAARPMDSWANLTWGHLANDESALQAMTHLRLAQSPAMLPSADDDPVFDPDPTWDAATDASDVAGITFQRPFRVAIHADDLLPDSA